MYFGVAPTVFSLFFVFFVFLFLAFLAHFSDCIVFFCFSQKNTKNLKAQIKLTKKLDTLSCVKTFVERGLLRPRRAGQSSAKNGQPQDPQIWTRIRPASVPLWGVDPATDPLPGPQNEVKKARKKRQK